MLLNQPQAAVPEAAQQRGFLSRGVEFVAPVQAQGVQHSVAGGPRAVLADENGLVHQPGDQVQDLTDWQAVSGADLLGGVQVEAVGKHRQPLPEQLFGPSA